MRTCPHCKMINTLNATKCSTCNASLEYIEGMELLEEPKGNIDSTDWPRGRSIITSSVLIVIYFFGFLPTFTGSYIGIVLLFLASPVLFIGFILATIYYGRALKVEQDNGRSTTLLSVLYFATIFLPILFIILASYRY